MAHHAIQPVPVTARQTWAVAASIVVIALVSSWIGIHNGFTYDDVFIVQTNKTWMLQFLILCRAVGAGTVGSLFCIGHGARGNQAAAAVADMVPDLYPAATPAAVGVDTTLAKALSITATPSLATASLTGHHYLLEATP